MYILYYYSNNNNMYVFNELYDFCVYIINIYLKI